MYLNNRILVNTDCIHKKFSIDELSVNRERLHVHKHCTPGIKNNDFRSVFTGREDITCDLDGFHYRIDGNLVFLVLLVSLDFHWE